MPRVSIILPCFNGADCLGETLESVLSQDFTGYELILINDGSTDTTETLVMSFRDRFGDRLRYQSGPNRGVCAARNQGMALARGEYLQFLDHDDLLRPGTLGRRVAALDTSAADVLYCDWQELRQGPEGAFQPGRIFARRLAEAGPAAAHPLLTGAFWAPPAALLYRRRIAERVGGWAAELAPVEDGCFLFEAARHGGRFEHLPGVGADYRIFRGNRNLSRQNRTRFWQAWLRHVTQVEELWRTEGLDDDRRRTLLQAYCRESLTSHLYEHDRATFRQVYRRIRALDPDHLPVDSPRMRRVARLAGYPAAEALALALRRLQAVFRPPPGAP